MKLYHKGNNMTTETHFSPQDFYYFNSEKARDPEANGERLVVKRKLQVFGKQIMKAWKAQGREFRMQTSLHHPYIYNNYSVSTMWLYFCPSGDEEKKLAELLGPYLAKDLKSHYQHTILCIQIDSEEITVGLKIHPMAWWDGKYLQERVKKEPEKLLEILRKLKGYVWRLHDFPEEHKCDFLTLDSIRYYFNRYTPGEHWFIVERYIPKGPEVYKPEFLQELQTDLINLLPLYDFVHKFHYTNEV